MTETGVFYFANGWLHHFERDLEDILAYHCTCIVHCFSENELIFAQHDEELLSQALQILRDCVTETRKEKLVA
jgi:hypothetical protein